MNRIQGAMVLLSLAGCMEGSKPTPQSRHADSGKAVERSLYERLGGEKALVKVVDDFVANVVADPNIKEAHKKHFMAEDVGILKKKLVDQIGAATGGPQVYQGKNMKDAHKGLKITNADFDALAGDLVKALDQNKVAKPDKDQLMAMLGSMKADVVEAPD